MIETAIVIQLRETINRAENMAPFMRSDMIQLLEGAKCEIETLTDNLKQMQEERDDARREICIHSTKEPYRQMCGSGILLPQDAARERGWSETSMTGGQPMTSHDERLRKRERRTREVPPPPPPPPPLPQDPAPAAQPRGAAPARRGRESGDTMTDDELNKVIENLRHCDEHPERASIYTFDNAIEAIEQLRKERDEERQDAARYRWLKGGGLYALPSTEHGLGEEYDFREWDQLIEAKMKEKTQ